MTLSRVDGLAARMKLCLYPGWVGWLSEWSLSRVDGWAIIFVSVSRVGGQSVRVVSSPGWMGWAVRVVSVSRVGWWTVRILSVSSVVDGQSELCPSSGWVGGQLIFRETN